MLLPLPLQNNIAGTGMARQLRKKSETGVYHVMLRGINRQDIFEDEGDYQQMVSVNRQIVNQHGAHARSTRSRRCTSYTSAAPSPGVPAAAYGSACSESHVAKATAELSSPASCPSTVWPPCWYAAVPQ